MLGDVSTLSDPSKPVTPAPPRNPCTRLSPWHRLEPLRPMGRCACGFTTSPTIATSSRRPRVAAARASCTHTPPPTLRPPPAPPTLRPPPSRLAPVQVRHDGVRARGAGGRLWAHRLLSTGGQRAGRGAQLTHPEPHHSSSPAHPEPLPEPLPEPEPQPHPEPLPQAHPQLQPRPHPRAHSRPRPHQVAKFLVHNAREQAPGGDSIDNFFSQQKRVSGADDVRSPLP